MPAQGWQLGIGDPSLVGWVTTAAYLVACAAALQAARGAHKGVGLAAVSAVDRRVIPRFWALTCMALLLLGLNKQLDLQTLFTQCAKRLSQQQGWYEERRRYQALFVVAIVGAGGALAAWTAFRLRRLFKLLSGALVGLGLVGAYVVIRAAMFQRLGPRLASVLEGWLWVLELGGIALVLFSARRFLSRHGAGAASRDGAAKGR